MDGKEAQASFFMLMQIRGQRLFYVYKSFQSVQRSPMPTAPKSNGSDFHNVPR